MSEKLPIEEGSWLYWAIAGAAAFMGGWWKSVRAKSSRKPNGDLELIRGQIVALNGRIIDLDKKIDEVCQQQESTARHISWMAGKLGYDPFKE